MQTFALLFLPYLPFFSLFSPTFFWTLCAFLCFIGPLNKKIFLRDEGVWLSAYNAYNAYNLLGGIPNSLRLCYISSFLLSYK